MLIELKTKRRWILSVLETVAEVEGSRLVARATVKQTSLRRHAQGAQATARDVKSLAQPTVAQVR